MDRKRFIAPSWDRFMEELYFVENSDDLGRSTSLGIRERLELLTKFVVFDLSFLSFSLEIGKAARFDEDRISILLVSKSFIELSDRAKKSVCRFFTYRLDFLGTMECMIQ